jgi:hypothetical protein
MLDEGPRRELARAALLAGKLPTRPAERTWGGPGIGSLCGVCGAKIPGDELELEIEIPGDGALPYVEVFHLHVRCFAAWEFEWTHVAAGAASGEPAARARASRALANGRGDGGPSRAIPRPRGGSPHPGSGGLPPRWRPHGH